LDGLKKKKKPAVVEPAETPVVQEGPAKPEPENKQAEVEKTEVKTEEAPVQQPQVEEKQEPKQPEIKAEELKPEPMEEEKKQQSVQENKEDEVFKIRPTEFKSKINVVGQIDLAALNQSTRPKKKSKEEKKKEREEKDKQRQEQRKQMKDAIIKEIRKSDEKTDKGGLSDEAAKKKKRNRINKERVDINATSNASGASRNEKSGKNNQNQGQGGKHNKDRFKKPVVKQEVSDEDVAKQVKETLARLTNKGKNKAAKYRKEKRENIQNRQLEQEELEQEESKVLKLTEFVTANELANMMDIPVTQVISTCMSVGIMVSINQRLDAETINLVAEEFGYKTEYVSAEVAQAVEEEADAEEDLQPRAPIVTVMGHVDHGKTSLLDYIRKANVIAGEAGGITQHIGAYNVKLEDGRRITFLDTPGHEAFTAMRARGAKVTDVVIIIVAADDNVMPQTKEAINHAMAAGVPIVFAINKVDKPNANPDKIKEELAAMNFLVEEWGGKYQSQDISAKKGTGVPELLEKVLLEAEMLDLKANPNRKATGSIIESSLDKGRGYVATAIISGGHTNFVYAERNGQVLFDHRTKAGAEADTEEVELNLSKVYDFATTTPLDEIRFILEAKRLNLQAAERSFKGNYGHELGKTLQGSRSEQSIMGSNTFTHILSYTSAACDARMAGAMIPVMSNSGSGNQGIAATLPVVVFAEENHKTEEELIRALVLSHLTAIYIKQNLGRLSALCGCVVAATGSSCGITYLMGGEYKQVAYAVQNMIANLTGMICDGAKPSCALKLTSGVSTAVFSAILAMEGKCVTSVEGIIEDNVDFSIRNLTKIGSEGMNETDKLVLDIMTHKHCD
jgi:small GTP-binding protein